MGRAQREVTNTLVGWMEFRNQVGRWKSGAPLALTPSQDDTTLGADPNQNNNFDFSDDQGERRCPYAAHIRKTNPRADFDQRGLSQEKAVDPRRVIRAGIRLDRR
jgi:deferrochelatase/peroxidase EfeB